MERDSDYDSFYMIQFNDGTGWVSTPLRYMTYEDAAGHTPDQLSEYQVKIVKIVEKRSKKVDKNSF